MTSKRQSTFQTFQKFLKYWGNGLDLSNKDMESLWSDDVVIEMQHHWVEEAVMYYGLSGVDKWLEHDRVLHIFDTNVISSAQDNSTNDMLVRALKCCLL